MKVRIYTGWGDLQGNTWDAYVHVPDNWAKGRENVSAAADPCVIEWAEAELLDPVQGSSLTLRLMSDNDRQFIDLYTAKPMEITCKLYRNSVLYWQGSLDPEIYEEPYTAELGYEVAFTFVDFGAMDRVPFAGTGVKSLHAIIGDCLSLGAGLPTAYVLATSLKTRARQNGIVVDTPLQLQNLYVDCSNFYDEEGEAMTQRQVAEAVLQPLGLKMVQKGGAVHVCDIDALAKRVGEMIDWTSTDQRIGAGKTYNNVELSFSSYSNGTIMHCDPDHAEVLKGATSNYKVMTSNHWNDAADGFTFHYEPTPPLTPTGLPYDTPQSIAFRIDPDFSGQECAGAAAYVKRLTQTSGGGASNAVIIGADSDRESHTITNNGFLSWTCKTIIRKTGIPVPVGTSGAALRIKLEALIDVRYNPFEQASVGNEEGNFKRMDGLSRCYLPCKITWHSSDGSQTRHINNDDLLIGTSALCIEPMGWTDGAASWGDCYLCYYEDNLGTGAIGGWKTNRQPIGTRASSLTERIAKMPDGFLLAMPPGSGTIDIEIGSGVYFGTADTFIWSWSEYASTIRWMLYRNLDIDVVKTNGAALPTCDIVESAWITQGARETLSIDTTVGTLPASIKAQAARGTLLQWSAADAAYKPVGDMVRNDYADRPERLLIGTAFSQFAGRKATLSGTCRIVTGIGPLTDRATAGKFAIVGEVQYPKQAESRISAVEIVEDYYTAI